MNFSVKGEYALKAIFDLSTQNGREPVKIADIARRQEIPQKFLELILSSLKQGGFVESRRGAEGGYMLARPAESITMGSVLRYVEGPRDKTRALAHVDSPFGAVWERVDQAIASELDTTNFATLVRDWTEKKNQFVPNWEI
jgi:Rrf2 family transcriptional regulator, cysteine metabolism repressor